MLSYCEFWHKRKKTKSHLFNGTVPIPPRLINGPILIQVHIIELSLLNIYDKSYMSKDLCK